MDRAGLLAIWEQVKANKKRLDECPGPHEFDFDPDAPASTLKERYACRKCGGEMRAIEMYTYLEGLKHGRNS